MYIPPWIKPIKDNIIPYVEYDMINPRKVSGFPKIVNKNMYVYPKDRIVKIDIEGKYNQSLSQVHLKPQDARHHNE